MNEQALKRFTYVLINKNETKNIKRQIISVTKITETKQEYY